MTEAELYRRQAMVDHAATTETLAVYAPTVEQSPAIEWLSIPTSTEHTAQLVRKYIAAIEEHPRNFCSCLYRQMPEEDGGGLRRINEDGDCILHSRHGLIEGFFKWLKDGNS